MGTLLLGNWTTDTASGTHDILIDGNGRAETTSSLAQRVDIRLRTFAGEHWLNPEIGVPWFSEFLRKSPDLRLCRQILAAVIQGVDGVQVLESLVLSLDKKSRRMIIDFRVRGVDRLKNGSTVVADGVVDIPYFVVGDTGEFVQGSDGSMLFGGR